MAVPARPYSGNVVDVAWGQIAHDAAVAQDIQAGRLNFTTAAGGGSLAVTFPRPFASAPAVVLNTEGTAGSDRPPDAPRDRVSARPASRIVCFPTDRPQRSPPARSHPVDWLAIGPRA